MEDSWFITEFQDGNAIGSEKSESYSTFTTDDGDVIARFYATDLDPIRDIPETSEIPKEVAVSIYNDSSNPGEVKSDELEDMIYAVHS